ncbi:Glutathione s-transferase-like protein [Theobroma cacao]|uniref:Glutathione s-transferase-like protein n=1 Tax=Theobroma cacao TaxID=3641 RepID=A0A061ER95_THECC|nr:Glutathione s-transferase-like protein [Theobroma cacao]
MAEEVKVVDACGSPFICSVKLTLQLEGVQYEYIEEDVHKNKSPVLLKYNPVLKKVPVVIHNGKPIAKSLDILEYVEETWEGNHIWPEDPYDRAVARCCKLIDEEVFLWCVCGACLRNGKQGEARRISEKSHWKMNPFILKSRIIWSLDNAYIHVRFPNLGKAQKKLSLVVPPVNPMGGSDRVPGPGAGMYPTRGDVGGGSMLLGPNDPRWLGGVGGEPGFTGAQPLALSLSLSLCVCSAYIILENLFWIGLFETGVFLLVHVLIHLAPLVFLVLSPIDLSGASKLDVSQLQFGPMGLILMYLSFQQYQLKVSLLLKVHLLIRKLIKVFPFQNCDPQIKAVSILSVGGTNALKWSFKKFWSLEETDIGSGQVLCNHMFIKVD